MITGYQREVHPVTRTEKFKNYNASEKDDYIKGMLLFYKLLKLGVSVENTIAEVTE